MKNISISRSSVAIGALLAIGMFVVMGQAGPSLPGSWGPPKKSVVNVFRETGSAVPAGGYIVLRQVPSDRWLTLTNVQVATAGCLCSTGPQGSGPCLVWAEQAGGTLTDKGFAVGMSPGVGLNMSPAAAGAELGWVFRPGSQVVIRNADTSPCWVYDFTLIGYESRD